MREVSPALVDEYRWIFGLSITEMEIIHGAYRHDNPNCEWSASTLQPTATSLNVVVFQRFLWSATKTSWMASPSTCITISPTRKSSHLRQPNSRCSSRTSLSASRYISAHCVLWLNNITRYRVQTHSWVFSHLRCLLLFMLLSRQDDVFLINDISFRNFR